MHEEQIKQNAFMVGCPLSKIPDYVGGIIGRTALAEAINTGKLPEDVAKTILEVLEVMQTMRTELRVPVDWAQSALVRPVVEERLQLHREQKNPIPRYLVVLRTSGTSFFQRIRGGQVITVPSEASAAGFLETSIADEAAKALKNLGINTKIETMANTPQRRKNTMTDDIEDLGLKGIKNERAEATRTQAQAPR